MGRATKQNNHSTVSDWVNRDPKTWNAFQRLHNSVFSPNRAPGLPVPQKMPVISMLSQHMFIISFIMVPLSLHQTYVFMTGHSLAKLPTFLLYTSGYILSTIQLARVLGHLAHRVGYLDNNVARDGLANTAAGKLISELAMTTGFRLAMAVILAYNVDSSPWEALGGFQACISLLVKLSLYGPVLDLFFYIYHRACHEIPALWMYHRTHHLNKHPTTVHAAFADEEQEMIEMVLVPALTYTTFWFAGYPLGFYEWWVCLQYITYPELVGHSGLRVYATPPTPTSWFFQLLGVELVLEDHDLHHRKGWKKAVNYGKQTRIWDRLFGTCGERIETVQGNVDLENKIYLPIFVQNTE
ncbi:hypothetical protein LMH87_001319 [Akanthomyces muscarius]|uniref:Fatty acid hydroxylase domain-containing protein n=1 Tax=Akanthomyces muscarius TaxID=2231603 RepID=A0A9W8QI08_AKAMU|nr:hypothetical protein LMH87_001319 [Akanthomyces muscarius]KAJ4156106.1 hypothetical protein LMH87_001319 [Akanthomyces muscarius]